jgi:hypothetical protein
MLDRLASNSGEERQSSASRLPAPAIVRIRKANDRRTQPPERGRWRRRNSSRSAVGGLPEALGDVADSRSTVTARSPDGTLALKLYWRPGGVLMQRSELRPGDTRVVQAMLFASARAFALWCESDQLRFAYPLLFSNLARSGRDLFDNAG